MLKELTEILNLLLVFFEKSGYLGIFLCMAIESTIVPLPSELIIPPAAYLAYQGKMNFFWVVLLGTAGSLVGAFVNYFVALRIGRPAFFLFVKKYGKFFFISEESFLKVERFWNKHGHISVFIGRLLPGFRHLVSIPAGLTRMNLGLFALFTALGAGLWCLFLAVCGYLFGKNSELLKAYIHKGSVLIILFCLLIIAGYVFYRKHLKKENL